MTVLGLLLLFTLLGYSWVRVLPGGLLLAPIVGQALIVLLGYILSTNLGITGASAVTWAIPILLLGVIGREWILRTRSQSVHDFWRQDLLGLAWLVVPVLLFLLPALQLGIENFFAVGNFDFFYNSEDGIYLAAHSVNQYDLGRGGEVLPLGWSANAQGRFGISLLSSFAYSRFQFNPLHFNAAVLTANMVMAALAIYVLLQRFFAMSRGWAVLGAVCFIFSAGYAQGYSYFLLGQISAIPLFLLVLINLQALLLKWGDAAGNSGVRSQKWDLVALVFCINALYVFYAILAFFSIALLLLIALAHAVRTRSWQTLFSHFMLPLLAVVLAFFVFRLFSLSLLIQTFHEWVVLAFKTAAARPTGPKVFTEYLTEAVGSIVFGVVRYPSNESWMEPWLGWGGPRSALLLSFSVLSMITFLWAIFGFWRIRFYSFASRVVMASLSCLVLVCAAAFFLSGSGYALFKIGSWFVPVCLMMLVALLSQRRNIVGRSSRWVAWIGGGLLGLNVLTAANYLYPFLKLNADETRRVNSGVFSMTGISQFRDWAPPGRHLYLDFMDAIRAAWFANEFRDREVRAYSHNLQPLAERLVQEPVCPIDRNFGTQPSLLVVDHALQGQADIVSMYPTPHFSHQAGRYQALLLEDLEFYASLGRGTYPAHTLSDRDAKSTGLPKTFRWVEHGFELYVYARVPGVVDVVMDAVPGYVLGSDLRTMTLQGNLLSRTSVFSKQQPTIHFAQLPVQSGLNCFHLQSSDAIEGMKRYGAIFRDEVMVDARILNYAVGNLVVRYQR